MDPPQTEFFDISSQLHGLLPPMHHGIVSVYRALKQRPRSGQVAARFDIPVTPTSSPGKILRDICDLWTDLAVRSGRDFHLIPIRNRALRLLQRPLSDPAYLLVLARYRNEATRPLLISRPFGKSQVDHCHNTACFLQLLYSA